MQRMTDVKRGCTKTLNDVFGVLRDVGVSASQIAEVQMRLAALNNSSAKDES